MTTSSRKGASGRDNGERLVTLALLVKEEGPLTFGEIRSRLATEYGVDAARDDEPGAQERSFNATRRMFERDKRALRDYGVFFTCDEAGRYSLDREASFAAPVELTQAEESLLRLLASALLEDEGYPFKSELRMVLVKIADELDVPDLLPGMDEDSGTGAERQIAGFKKMRKALAARKRLSFSYRNARGAASEREVEPFGCFFLENRCYFVAYDPQRQGERVFRLDRCSHLHVNGKSPEQPDFADRPFDVADYLGLPFQYGGAAFETRIRCDADNAWRARRLSKRQGSFAQRDDGSSEWTVLVRDADALARWCIENGPGLEPVSPPEAARAYRTRIEGALAALDAAEQEGGAR